MVDLMSQMNIQLRSLQHVVVLARLLSYTKAAEELNITQSALTRSIQALEKSFDARLFDRDRAGVQLTAVGRDFVRRAEVLLHDANDLAKVLQRSAKGEAGEISIGMAPLPANTLLTPLLLAAIKQSPGLRINVAVREVLTLLSMLLDEKIEFFVCAEGQLPPAPHVKSVAIGWFQATLLVRVGHPLLALPQISQGDLAEYPLISSGLLQYRSDIASQALSYLGRQPTIIVENYETLRKLTENSNAIWVASMPATLNAYPANELVELPIAARPLGRFRMAAYRLDRRSLSPAAERAIGLLRARS
jgi:DNA-binding transcriptional LysR family regulator